MIESDEDDNVSQPLLSPRSILMRHGPYRKGFLISASWDKSLIMYDILSGEILHKFIGHNSMVTGCAISASGNILVSSSEDKTVRVWDIPNRKLSKVLEEHNDEVTSCSISESKNFIVSSSKDYTLKVWMIYNSSSSSNPLTSLKKTQKKDTHHHAATHTLVGHTHWVLQCKINSINNFIISCSSDKTIRIWSYPNFECVRVLEGHELGVFGCNISSDGKDIISCSADKTVRLWDFKDGTLINTFYGHHHQVEKCCFYSNNKLIISTSSLQEGIQWDRSGKILNKFSGCACIVSPDDSTIFSCIYGINVYSSYFELLRTLTGHSSVIEDMALYIPKKKKAGKLLCQSIADYKLNHPVWFEKPAVFIIYSSSDGTIVIYDLQEKKSLYFVGHSAGVNKVAISQDRNFLLSASDDKTLRYWDSRVEKSILVLKGHDHKVYGCDLLSDNSWALSGSEDATIRIWDLVTGNPLKLIKAEEPVHACLFSQQEKSIISSLKTGEILLITNSDERTVLKGHRDVITFGGLLVQKNLIISASFDNKIMLWDQNKQTMIRQLDGHSHWITSCDVSPCSEFILSSSFDKTVRLWNLITGESTVFYHLEVVSYCSFSKIPGLFWSASNDSILRLWDIQSQECIFEIPNTFMVRCLISMDKDFDLHSL